MAEYAGASHADELTHLFKAYLKQISDIPPSDDDQLLRKKLVKAWTQFAKVGDPNCNTLGITWPADNIQSPKYLDIGNIWKVKSGTCFPERESFWKKVYDKYSYSY